MFGGSVMAGHDWIGSAVVPGGVELRLMQKGDEFTIVLEDNELMSTRVSASEEALATLTCAALKTRPAPDLLIGGYGMGFTLRAALKSLFDDASLTVAELVPEIIEWARGPMRALTAGCLDDARVIVVNDDVAMLIAAACNGYDAILLDVDNGPEGLSRHDNGALYSDHGLQAAMRALKSGGLLAIWSVSEDAAFTRRLNAAGFAVTETAVMDGADDDGDCHHLWFAQKP